MAQLVGSQGLLRSLFLLKAEGETTIASAGQATIPIETLGVGEQHSFYVYSIRHASVSVFAQQTSLHDAGLGATGNAAYLQAGIQTRRSGNPFVETLVELVINNHSNANRLVKYKVYRIAALV
jgi:hypothetical protein